MQLTRGLVPVSGRTPKRPVYHQPSQAIQAGRLEYEDAVRQFAEEPGSGLAPNASSQKRKRSLSTEEDQDQHNVTESESEEICPRCKRKKTQHSDPAPAIEGANPQPQHETFEGNQ